MPNRDIVIEFLKNLSNEELFYQICQEKQYSAEQIRTLQTNFASRLSFPDGTPLPETLQGLDMIPLPEENTVDTIGTRKVHLIRHDRYAPPVIHSHDCFEAVYVLEGTCRHCIFTKEYVMQTGDLTLLSPAVHHSIYADQNSIVIRLLIDRSVMENIYSNAVHQKIEDTATDFFCSSIYQHDYASFLTFHTAEDEEIRGQILDMFLEEFQPDEYADFMLTNMLVIFFIKVMRKYKKTAEGPDFVPPSYAEASFILRYIQSNYANASLNELAKQLNYSVPYCSKYVRICTGRSFSDLLNKIRFEAATEYLLKSDLTVERISERIGYSNPENFMRMFKKTYGITPTQYRAKCTALHKPVPKDTHKKIRRIQPIGAEIG